MWHVLRDEKVTAIHRNLHAILTLFKIGFVEWLAILTLTPGNRCIHMQQYAFWLITPVNNNNTMYIYTYIIVRYALTHLHLYFLVCKVQWFFYATKFHQLIMVLVSTSSVYNYTRIIIINESIGHSHHLICIHLNPGS